MPIAATDLKSRACANYVENDTATAGGAVDGSEEVSVGVLAADDDLEALSSNAGDTTQLVTVRTRVSSGLIADKTATLNGTTAVDLTPLTPLVNRVLRVTVDALTGTLTVRRRPGGATVVTVEGGESLIASRRLFSNANDSGGGLKYDKSFWRNAHATLAAVSPVYRLTADPSAKIRQGIHTSKNDTVTIANRTTAPGGVTFVDDNVDQTGSDLVPTDAQGVWWELTATGGPLESSFTSQITVASI